LEYDNLTPQLVWRGKGEKYLKRLHLRLHQATYGEIEGDIIPDNDPTTEATRLLRGKRYSDTSHLDGEESLSQPHQSWTRVLGILSQG
jgi:hypothetical protein